MSSDPISDLLARLRNAAQAHHERTTMPLSRVRREVAELLKQEGFVSDVEVDESGHGTITVVLKYGKNRQSAIVGLRRRSRPGRRIYVGVSEIPKTQHGIGISILSTSSGIMTDRTAREKGVGGELLCEVW
ncbi:MAG: 30S ribosomal protein S8 [Sandaracinus sp.]